MELEKIDVFESREEVPIINLENRYSIKNAINKKFDDWFYVKDVVGKNGVHFKCYKIETMDKNAEENFKHVKKNGFDINGKVIDDPRITKKGLRRNFIDELPQLFINVPKGNMGFVGMRPNSEQDWEKYPSDIREKERDKKPGVAGVHYFPGKGSNISKIRQYQKEREQSPILTNIKYGFGIAFNILVLGVRSS